jgi:phosphomannomutase
MILAFDVDGTLTDARQPIDPKMLDAMLSLCETHEVWIVTGSDKPKCQEQLGPLWDAVARGYCCAGAELWIQDELIRAKSWNPPVQLIIDLFSALHESGYTELCGKHVEVRTGMVNLSIPGRQASVSQRDAFADWDQKTNTRKHIASQIKRLYPSLSTTLGGKTSIDITPAGWGKHVVLEDANQPVWFWGDECKPGGNDASLAEAIRSTSRGRVFETRNWQDTYHQISEVFGTK